MNLIEQLKSKSYQLKLKNHKGITEEIILKDLGLINVICGKNNSGKTSILEAICLEKKRAFGIEITEEVFNDLFEEVTSWIDNNGPQNFSHLYPQIRTCFEKSFLDLFQGNDNKTLFQDKLTPLMNLIGKNFWENPNLARNSNWLDQLNRVINNYFEPCNNSKFFCIPPKRKIESTASISTGISVNKTGAGLINKLFYLSSNWEAKNKDFSSEYHKCFRNISNQWDFEISADQENKINLMFRYANGNLRKAEDCGLGLQDLMVILYFLKDSEQNVICIEEPENHMHPEMQKRLLDFISKNVTDKQIFISTHSNVFLSSGYVDKIFHCSYDEKVSITDETSIASILHDLGYSVTDNLLSDLVILVEGPTDVPVIEEFLIKMDLYGKYNIKLWPLGGSIMSKVDLSVFAERYNIMALVDNEPKNVKARNRFKEKCRELKIPCHQLKFYALENYFAPEAIKAVFVNQLPKDFKNIEPDRKLEKQIHLDVKKNNRKIAKAMSLKDIEGTDLMRFFKKAEKKLDEISTGT